MVIPIKSFAQAQKKVAINERKCDLQTAPTTTRAHLWMETGIRWTGGVEIFPENRANRFKAVHSETEREPGERPGESAATAKVSAARASSVERGCDCGCGCDVSLT